MSTELLGKVDEILKNADIPERHSYFQIEKFMIGKEVTTQAQLWAIARELQAKRETVDSFHLDLEEAEDNLELIDIQIEKLDRFIRKEADQKELLTDLNIQEHEINIRKLRRKKQGLIKSAQKVNKKLKGMLEEINHLVKGYEQIVTKFEQMKPFDDEAAQKEMWEERLLEEFNLRLILNRPLDPEFVKTVLCLPNESGVKGQMIALVQHLQQRFDKSKAIPEKQQPKIKPKPRISGR